MGSRIPPAPPRRCSKPRVPTPCSYRSVMTIQVDGIAGFAYLISIGEHELVVDQPVEDGGEDLGPTPTDLFVAGLASCAAYYAGRFLARRGIVAESVRARD